MVYINCSKYNLSGEYTIIIEDDYYLFINRMGVHIYVPLYDIYLINGLGSCKENIPPN